MTAKAETVTVLFTPDLAGSTELLLPVFDSLNPRPALDDRSRVEAPRAGKIERYGAGCIMPVGGARC